MEAADRDGVVEQNAVVGDIDRVDGDFPALAEGVSRGGVEGGVDGKIRAVIRALIGAGKTVGETRTVVDIGREPCVAWKVGGEAGIERVALIVVDGRVGETQIAGWIGGMGAGKATDNVASLLCDLIRVSQVELA